jgi:branched-subunit amino acid transport protein
MKAAGPVAMGDRALPAVGRRVVALLAPVLLAALIVVELGGESWQDLEGDRLAGVAVAGLARVARAPMLVAVLCGVAATAGLRLWVG